MKSNALIQNAYVIDSLDSGTTVHHALVSGAGVDIRVDWAGGSMLGAVDVLDEDGIWEGCVNVEIEGPCDLLMARSDFDHVRLTRGPKWGMYPFEARLVPIEWKDGHEPTGDIADDAVVELGVDYEYPDGMDPDSLPWQASVLQQGVHCLTVQHDQTASYELWVRLQDPFASQVWVSLRPIVRPGDGDPTPTPT